MLINISDQGTGLFCGPPNEESPVVGKTKTFNYWLNKLLGTLKIKCKKFVFNKMWTTLGVVSFWAL